MDKFNYARQNCDLFDACEGDDLGVNYNQGFHAFLRIVLQKNSAGGGHQPIEESEHSFFTTRRGSKGVFYEDSKHGWELGR
ncbi:MAG: hypothetical protein ACR2IL_11330 [Chitinophagaceae bacterium]